MRKVVAGVPLLAVALVGAVLAGCIGLDDADDHSGDLEKKTGFVEFPPPEEVLGVDLLAALPLGNVNELTMREGFAYLSGNSGSFIVDITDPSDPELVAEIQCTGIHVRTIQLEERLLMTLSSQSNDNCDDAAPGGGIRLIDVTDPHYPVVGTQLPLALGSHTHTPYGDSGIIYNSAYNLYTNIASNMHPEPHMRSEIIDVSDWENPVVVDEFMFPAGSISIGCHDMWPVPEWDRVYCAAISETQIWDTSDPLSPQIISTIHNPAISIHHTSTVSEDGNVLIIGDEWTGAIGPGCFDGGTAPIGSIWFYDISDETDPQLLSYFAPPHMGPGIPCTAHNFNTIEGHDVLVAAFFTAGTAVIDFSDPSSPTLIDLYQPGETDVWAAYYHNGHIFTGDRGRGLDVLMFTGEVDNHDHDGFLGGLLPEL
jgi:hypothetical protein